MESKIFYVQLEPTAFLSDPHFISQTADQKGLYLTILLLLYQNKGRIRPDDPGIRRLANWTGSESSFDVAIQDLNPSFYVRRGWLRHRRVDKELKKAQAAIQQRVNAANSRWKKDATALRPHSGRRTSKGNEEEKKRKEIESKQNGFSFDYLPRYDALSETLQPRNKSDETMLRKIVFYIFEMKFSWDRVYAIADQATKAVKPMAYFHQSIKTEFGDYKNARTYQA